MDCSCGKSLGFGLRSSGFIGLVFESTKHLSEMGTVSLVPKMRWYGILLSLLLGLRPRARYPSACVRLGDLSGVAQINLVLKTVSYYPQTEE
jgi:hypothetical protein